MNVSITSNPSELQAPQAVCAEVFEENLRYLGLGPHTETALRAATANAKVTSLPSGGVGLTTRGHVLDAHVEVNVPKSTDSVTVIFGLGAGNTVREVRAQTSGRVVVYEPDAGIARAVLEHGPVDLGDVDLVTDLFDLSQAWPAIAQTQTTVTVVRSAGYSDLFPAQAATLTSKLEELVARVGVNVNTYRTRAAVWVDDLLENLELLVDRPTFMALENALPGVPAFIVGAGPSLGKNGPLLAEAAKKGLVISVNTSARALASYGVEPQVLACLESVDVSHLLKDLPFIDRVVRAISLTAHPNTLRTGQGPLLPVYEALPEISFPLAELTGLMGLPVCGSVTTAAFSLAQRLGCNPIVLVGQDLAYTDGQAYARGTAYADSKARISEDGQCLELDWCDTLKQTHNAGTSEMHEREAVEWVTAWGGKGIVPTGMSFTPVRAWFGDAAKVLEREFPGTSLVNATEGGARIDGFREQSLADVLASLPERRVSNDDLVRRARCRMKAVSADALRSFALQKAEAAGTVGKRARHARALATRALGAMRQGEHGKIPALFAKLEAAEAALREAVRRAPLVDTYGFAEVDAALGVQSDSGDAANDARTALEREVRVTSAIIQASKRLRTKFLSMAARLEASVEGRQHP
ncbi:MAG: 6-hydroxymethylpterin diphosphokinase MptE-like protein [Polyangiaceae bacterium]